MPTPPSRHRPARASLGILLLASAATLGCPKPGDDGDADETGGECLLAGSLVISEITANVAGADAGLEWFEIYNASSETIDLEGLYLNYEKVDGSGSKAHQITRSLEVPPGGFVVVGAMTDESAAGSAHVDYGYGGDSDLGELGNTSGYLAIGCENGDVIDEVFYADALDTASKTFDGAITPDAIANDDLDSWCESTTEFIDGFAATPGAVNDPCGSSTTCGDGVDIVSPAVGEVVITEVLPGPDAPMENSEGEWFEVHSLADHDVHLNGLWIGKSIDDPAEHRIASLDCITLAPGAYKTIVANPDPEANGMIPPASILYVSPVTLTNSDSSVWLGLDEDADTLIDLVTWASTSNGTARQLDPDAIDPLANDDLVNWCAATTAYGLGDLGTPGEANPDCPIEPVDGMCVEDGTLRPIDPPQMGEIAIYEVMPDSAGASDTTGEWFEIRADATFDLNGLELGKDGEVSHTVEAGECLTVHATDYFVFARSDVDNCALPFDYSYDGDLSLNNSDGNLQIGYAGDVLHEYSWASSDAGVAQQYDADLDMWCDATEAYGDCAPPDDNFGTPGAQNTPCGGTMMGDCIDPQVQMPRNINTPMPGELILSELMPNPSTAEPGGEWIELYTTVALDLNGLELYDTGALAHTVMSDECIEIPANTYVVIARSDVAMANCMLPSVAYVYSGLGMANGGDTVEIGYGGMVYDSHTWGGSGNGTALSYDPMAMQWCDAVDVFGCGDRGTPGTANPACGGMMMGDMCLDGMMMRPIVTPIPGDLVISEFMANPNAVSDAAGEWFEVHALADVDLNGVDFGRAFMAGTLDTVTSNDCIALSQGETALFARNTDSLQNGGLPAVDVQMSFGLNNSNSALHIAANGVLLDEITWTSVATGSSTSLDPGSLDPNMNDVADNALPWCYATTPYGDGDDGTPGAANPQCP